MAYVGSSEATDDEYENARMSAFHDRQEYHPTGSMQHYGQQAHLYLANQNVRVTCSAASVPYLVQAGYQLDHSMT